MGKELRLTRAEVIKFVNARTENALIDQVDFNDLFNDCLQELCAEHRFWWLKKRLTFTTVGGTPVYDLTQITTVPAGVGIYVDEITHLVRIDSSGNVCEMNPVFGDEAITQMVADTTQDKPGIWTMENNDIGESRILRLGKIPDGAYTIYVYFWAMPDPQPDDSGDDIPLVPSTKHHILKTSLEKEVWRLKYGEQDPKYITALNLYNKKVAAAKVRPSFSTQQEQRFINHGHEAIRSTGR